MKNRKPTPKQAEILAYLRDYVAAENRWPTYREIVVRFGFKSPNSVTQNLQALERKGHVRRNGRNGWTLASYVPPSELERRIDRLQQENAALRRLLHDRGILHDRDILHDAPTGTPRIPTPWPPADDP